MGSFSNTPNFDNLLLQTLMNRLQLRPTTATSSSSLNQTLEDLLFDNLNLNLSDNDDDDDQTSSDKSQLAKEESRLEKSIIKTILSGENIEQTLKPNSGQAVTINDHHICVGFHREADSGYRVWEWHGHIMLFDDENGYSPEYIYGNYFERVRDRGGVQVTGGGVERERESEGDEEEVEEEEEEKSGSKGLKELIGSGDDLGTGRILHRNLNAGSPRF